MKKRIRMLKSCKAYIDVHKIQEFERGKEYEVNEFLFESFTTTGRAEKVTASNKTEEGAETVQEETEEENAEIEEGNEDEGEDEDSDTEEETEEDFDELDEMSKKDLQKYAKSLNIEVKNNDSKEDLIKKIKEVQNG